MDILRIEETNKYGYLLKSTVFEKFFSDAVSGSKSKSLNHLLKYLVNAPKLFPHREFFKTDEYKDFCETIKDDLKFEFNIVNELRIDTVTKRVKIKSGIKTTYWEIIIIDQNTHRHVFDYDLSAFPTEETAVAQFNSVHSLNLAYSG